MTEENNNPFNYLKLAGMIAFIATASICVLYTDPTDDIKKAFEERAAYDLRVKNRQFDAVRLEGHEGRVKTIAAVSGHILVVLEDVDRISGTITIPTYDTGAIKLQETIRFSRVSLVYRNSEYIKVYMLDQDYHTIHDVVDDDYARSLYDLMNGYMTEGKVY